LGDPRAQTAPGDHVDVPLEEVLEVHQQTTEVERAPARFEVDQEVDGAP
jgi:hypothetical protein